MFDPTAATTSGAGASRPSSRRGWLPLLQPLMLLACFLLTLVVFSCPDPLSASSGITLLTVRPYNMTETTVSNGATNANSSSSSAGSTIVFGGPNATTSTSTASPLNATGAASATTNASTSTPSVSATSTADPATATSNRTLAASPAVAANESAAPAPASTESTANEPSKRSLLPLLSRTNYQPLNISSSSSRSSPAQLERVTDDPLDTHGSLNNGTSSSSPSTTISSNPSVSITTSPPTGESLSLLELKYGPLGSCFRTWSGARACTPASLKPSYDASHLTLKALGGFDTSGLPTTLKTTPALLVACISLLAALALSSGLAAGARLFPGTKMAAPLLQAGAAQRAWGTIQRAALWLRLGVALLLLGTAVSMRLVVSKAAYAFNASNAAKSIGAAYLTPEAATAAAGQHATGGATQVGLQAVAGKGFGLLWATVLMLLIDFFLERRRLRREEAVAVARADLEAAWGREAVAMANLGKGASAGEMKKKGKKVKVAQPHDSDDDDDIEGDEEEQVKPASHRRSFFWPASPRLSRPRKVARKAVPSYKGGLAPVLGPLFNPAPAPAPAPVQAQAPYAGHAGAAGQGAVYIVQDKGSGGRQAAPQSQRVVTRNDYHYHHHHQQAAPSRKGSMSSASMSSCSGAAAAPHAYYHQYGPAPRPQQQQQVAALPFESTAGGLASPPWASSTQMQQQQQQQQQQYGQSFTSAAAAANQGATLPA